MTPGRSAFGAALGSVTLLAAISVWGYTMDPVPSAKWILIASALPLLWAYVEAAQVRGTDHAVGSAIMTFHRWTLAWAGLLLASQIGIRLAVSAEILNVDWWPVGRRISGILFGVGLMVFGNYLPRLLSPWRLEDEPFEWQRVHRFCGWVFVMGGLGVTACWIIFPGAAPKLVTPLVVSTLVLAFARKLISLASGNGARASAQ